MGGDGEWLFMSTFFFFLRVLSESASCRSKSAGSDAGGGAGEVGGAGGGGSGSIVTTPTGLLEQYSTLSEEELSRVFVTILDFSVRYS